MDSANAILAFVASGKNLNSPEGQDLIKSTADQVIWEAMNDKRTLDALTEMHNSTVDPELREKLFRAFVD